MSKQDPRLFAYVTEKVKRSDIEYVENLFEVLANSDEDDLQEIVKEIRRTKRFFIFLTILFPFLITYETIFRGVSGAKAYWKAQVGMAKFIRSPIKDLTDEGTNGGGKLYLR